MVMIIVKIAIVMVVIATLHSEWGDNQNEGLKFRSSVTNKDPLSGLTQQGLLKPFFHEGFDMQEGD